MNKQGPIIVVEDDIDDQEMLQAIFKSINVPNEVIFLSDGQEAYDYLNSNQVKPFLILSDINMPRMSGIELRDKMQKDGDIRLRTTPYLFLTTAAATDTLINAYANSVQGFFQKAGNPESFKKTIVAILDYWKECAAPKFNAN